MKPRGRAFVLSPEYQALEDAYATDLDRLGFQVNSAWRWGARAFCVRFGDGAGWQALSLVEQLALNWKLQRFITWLMLTRRLRPSADYLVARRHELGPLLARMDPLSHATFTATALEIGFSSHAIQYQWGRPGSRVCIQWHWSSGGPTRAHRRNPVGICTGSRAPGPRPNAVFSQLDLRP